MSDFTSQSIEVSVYLCCWIISICTVNSELGILLPLHWLSIILDNGKACTSVAYGFSIQTFNTKRGGFSIQTFNTKRGGFSIQTFSTKRGGFSIRTFSTKRGGFSIRTFSTKRGGGWGSQQILINSYLLYLIKAVCLL